MPESAEGLKPVEAAQHRFGIFRQKVKNVDNIGREPILRHVLGIIRIADQDSTVGNPIVKPIAVKRRDVRAHAGI